MDRTIGGFGTVQPDEIRRLASKMAHRAGELQRLAETAPEQVRQLRAFASFYGYVADEYDRTSIKLPSTSSDLVKPRDSILYGLSIPSPNAIDDALLVISGGTSTITRPLVEVARTKPEMQILAHPPDRYRSMQAVDSLASWLDELKSGLGRSWIRAWASSELCSVASVRDVAANARAVVDGVSWLTPYDHIKTLNWCECDDKQQPTRASRYAWILHGDHLPDSLGGKPHGDPSWGVLKSSYEYLNRYVHVAQVTSADVTFLRGALDSIQRVLERCRRREDGQLRV